MDPSVYNIGSVVALGWVLFWLLFFVVIPRPRSRVSTKHNSFFYLLTWVTLGYACLLAVFMMYYSSKPVLYVLPLHLPLGVLLWGGGLGLVLWSRKAVKHLANREVLFRLAQEHTAKGPYQYMQHPMYIGITFALLGSALLLDNYMAAALVLVGMVPLFMLRAYIESH